MAKNYQEKNACDHIKQEKNKNTKIHRYLSLQNCFLFPFSLSFFSFLVVVSNEYAIYIYYIFTYVAYTLLILKALILYSIQIYIFSFLISFHFLFQN